MGGRQSKSTRRSASMGGYSSSGGPGHAYSAAAPGYAPSQNWYPSPYHPAAAPPPQPPAAKRKLQRRYSRIADNYNSLDEWARFKLRTRSIIGTLKTNLKK